MALSRVKVWGNEILTATDLNAEFNNIINNASSLISPLSGSLDWDGYAHTLDAAGVTTAQSTSAVAWSFTPGSKSGTPTTTGGITNYAASTWTDSNTAGSGTATSWSAHSIHRPTLAASNASVTTTDATTVYIANSPLAGTNETLTNAWAMWVDAGNVRFDDNIVWLSGTSFRGLLDHANSANRTYTFPDVDGTVITTGNGQATQADQETGTSTATYVTPGRQQFHASAAKMWIKAEINGTIAASYNVTSISDDGTGAMTVTIATDFSGTEYAIAASVEGAGDQQIRINDSPAAGTISVQVVNNGSAAADPSQYHLVAFGDQS